MHWPGDAHVALPRGPRGLDFRGPTSKGRAGGEGIGEGEKCGSKGEGKGEEGRGLRERKGREGWGLRHGFFLGGTPLSRA